MTATTSIIHPTPNLRVPEEAVGEAVQVSLPHPYPEGQQPPPKLGAQLAHPLAHAAPLVTITTVACPSVVYVLLASGGQEVLEQSRPTLQQAPAS